MRPTVSVITASIPPRAHLLERARASVAMQTYPVAEHIVEVDHSRSGAAVTRQRALDRATTDLVLPLDDDDELMPWAVERLVAHMAETGADMVYGWYEVVGGADPRPEAFGRPFDPEDPVQTTICVLARTDLAKECGYVDHGDLATLTRVDRHYHGEDALYIRRAIDRGAVISHLPERVFRWHHWGGNLSGLPKW